MISLLVAGAVLAIFIGIAVAIVAAKPKPGKAKVRETYFSVRTVKASIAPVRPSVLLVGEVEARDSAVLTAPIEAEVLNIPYREGRTFKKNARLMQLDLREQQLQAESQGTMVESTRLRLLALRRNRHSDKQRLHEMSRLLELAKNDYARNVTLHRQNLVARAQIESSEQALAQRRLDYVALQNQVANYDTEEQQLQQQMVAAEAALAQINLLIERGEMRAPFAGRVAKVYASTGARPIRGTPLLDIFNPHTARLRALVPNRYAPILLRAQATKNNAQHSVQALLLAEELDTAKDLALAHVSPRAESGQGGIEVFFTLPKGDWVLGATYEFELLLPPIPDALSLPIDSVYAQSRVYKVDADNRAQALQCERLGLSRQNGKTQALMRCPQASSGDSIIATQLPGLAEGSKVRIIAELDASKTKTTTPLTDRTDVNATDSTPAIDAETDGAQPST